MKLNNLIKRAFIAITMMLAVSVAASAHDFEAKNSDGATIYYNVDSSTDKTCEVTYQGNFSSEYSNEYTGNIIIPESVTYSGITYSVTSIGERAFEGCSGLTSVTIPNSVTSIIYYAFYGCSDLTSVTIPNSVKYIRDCAFYGCSDLTSVTIPNSVKEIGDYAFYKCSSLTSITIPEGVTSIGSCAFKGCSGLTSVTIPDGVTSIGYSAFSGCSSLISVTIPNSVTSIEDNAFDGCSGLTSVVIPNSVTSIGEYAFYGCSGLTSVTIPNSVTSIGDYAFSGCSGLTSVTIPNSVTSIGYLAFGGCSGLESIIVESGNAVYDSRNNCNAIIETTTNILIAGCKNSTIPNSVTSIGGAFAGCTGLTSVVIPNSVTSIGESAFAGCTGLTSVVIPNSVTYICDHAFSRCSSLTSITIGNSVKEIGFEAFCECISLTSITSLNPFPPSGAHVFSNLPQSVILYVPAESIEYYKLVEDWNFFPNIEALTIPAENITLDKNNISIKVSETTTLNITVLPENTTNKEVVWTSSDESVATVENGVVTAHKVGVATITATTTDGTNLSATCEVIVTPTVAENIALDKTSVSLEINKTVALNITILPETTTNKEVVWTSSDESVATVENGVVTAHKAGVATITATTTDGTNLSATCEVIVTPTVAENIALDKTSVSLEINETVALNITILPETTTNKEVVWTSSDESVATVENGIVTALKAGVATITATTTDGTNLSASCEVTVSTTHTESANQGIQPLWTIPADAATGLCSSRTVNGFGDTLFGANPTAGTIEEWKDGQLVASYDINGWCAANEIGETIKVKDEATGVETEKFATYVLWSSVMVDDAGNVLVNVGTGAGAASTCQNWILLPASNRNDMQFLHIDEFPGCGITPGRVDVPCNIVGDISTGAYMYIAPHGSNLLAVMYIGLDDDGKIYFDTEYSRALLAATTFDASTNVASFQTVDALLDAMEEGEVAADTYIRWRGQGAPFTWNDETAQFEKNSTLNQGAITPGMGVFAIADRKFMVVPVKSATTGTRGSSVAVYDLATNEEVASWDSESATDYYIGSVTARACEDGKSAYIYVAGHRDCFGILKFTLEETDEPSEPETPSTPTDPGVSAPTLTKVWEYTSGIPAAAMTLSATESAYGTGFNGTVYTVNKNDNTIYAWSKDQQKVAYANNANFTGLAITCDDAGNLLVDQGIYSMSATTWNIVAASSKVVTPITVTFPSDIASGNTYHVGRVVGNMLSSEGAYVYLTRAGVNKVACVKIANGAFVSATSSDAISGVEAAKVQTVSYAQPSMETVAQINASSKPANCFYFRDRALKNYYTTSATSFAAPSGSYPTDGGDVVTLSGKTYAMFPLGTTYGSAFSIVETSSKEVVAEEKNTVAKVSFYQSLVFEKVSETKANIYQYYAGGKVAMYTFEVPGTASIKPNIACDHTSLTFEDIYIGETSSKTITVTAEGLSSNIFATCSDNTNFAIDASSLNLTGGTLTVTYNPKNAGTHSATITLLSGSTSVLINLSASCEVAVKPELPEDTRFLVENISTLHGRVVELPVYLVNDSEISAFQFDVYLPEGITIAVNEENEYEMTLSADRTTSSHTVSTYKQPNGAIRYACYSTKSAAFKGESGTVLFTIPLTIAKDIEGEFNVQIKDIILSSPSALGYNNPDMNIVVTVEKYELGDSNGDGIINVLDVVTTVNATLGIPSENIITDAADVNGDGVINVLDIVATVNLVLNQTVNTQLNIKNIMRAQVLTETQARDNIFINDFTINASESKTIEVNMNNVDTYCAFQFDMYLPEGLKIDEEDEEFLIEATSRLTKSHMISTNKLSENVIRFVVYSNKNTNIKLNEGAIMTIPFTASAEMAAGSYQIEIKDVILSYNTGAGVNASNTITEVEVLSSTVTEIEEIVEDSSDIEYYNIQGIKVVNPSSGLYIKKQENKVTKVIL